MVYLVGILIFFILLILGLSLFRVPKKKVDPAKYIKGLETMVDGKTDEAIDILKNVIEKDTSNTGAYLRLGNLLREKGLISSAIKIHKNLSVNPELSASEKEEVNKALVKDYLESKEWRKALPIYEPLYKKNPKDKELAIGLLLLYEKQEKWDNAYNIAKKIYTKGKSLANYATHIASLLIGRDNQKARKFINFGLKANISYAHFLYGKLLIEDGKENNGIEHLEKSISIDPERAYLYLPLLEEYMFKRGEFSILEPYLKNLVSENPENWEILNSYISILKKKGDSDRVEEILDEAIPNLNIDSPEALGSIASAYSGVDTDKMSEYVLKMQRLLTKTKRFKCPECGNEFKEFSWKCSSCGSLGTIHRVWN
jgi:lipopolysaccharide biosynthesis regulator YciM